MEHGSRPGTSKKLNDDRKSTMTVGREYSNNASNASIRPKVYYDRGERVF